MRPIAKKMSFDTAVSSLLAIGVYAILECLSNGIWWYSVVGGACILLAVFISYIRNKWNESRWDGGMYNRGLL